MSESRPGSQQEKGMCVHGNFVTNCQKCLMENSTEKIESNLEVELKKVELARPGVEKAVLLDHYLEITETGCSFEDFLKKNQLIETDIPENLRDRFKTVIKEWNEFSEWNAGTGEVLKEKSREMFGDDSEENIGRFCFFGMGKENQSGKIIAKISGPYLLIYCEDPNDYQSILGSSKKSGGTFHRPFTTKITLTENRSSTPPILLVNNPPTVAYSRKVIIHERQHFLNFKWMPEKGLNKKDRIKDEVLAYIKDGRHFSEIGETLNGPSYDNLFMDPLDEDRKKVDEIVSELKKIGQFFRTETSRALLVFHLMDTSLDNLPRVINLLGKFEERRKKQGIQTFEIPGQTPNFLEMEFSDLPPDDDE